MKSKKQYYNVLLVDIGGNGVQYQINDKILSFSTIKKDKEYVLKMLAKISNNNNINNISVSSPGACNSKTGWIDGFSGIINYGNFNFYNELLEKLKNKETKILINNDANCCLAANIFSTGIQNAIQISIGTGIGGAIAIKGNLVVGTNGYAGEFGYGLTDVEGINISQKISANALVKRFDDKYQNAKDIFKNELDSDILNLWFDDLAKYIINLNYIFDSENIFLSGGITKNKSFYKKIIYSINKILSNNIGYTLKPNIKISQNINDGIVGAKYLLNKKGE